jgi:predicted amidohydrolase YtcJ
MGLAILILMMAVPVGAAEPAADLVLRGGAVYTMDAARSWAEAVAVRGGRIVYVGDDGGARALVGPGTRVVDLGGRMVLPSFQDAHVHPVSGGVELGQCDLNGIAAAEAIYARVRECVKEQAGRPWLVGGGWGLPSFEAAHPKKEALDALVADRPALLSAADGHSAWVNSRALAAAGITAKTPDPANGRIERDAAGEPTGTLRESAIGLVARLVPAPTLEERVAGLRRATERLNRAGVTAVQEASAGRAADEDAARATLETYREAERRGELSLRVVAAITVDPGRGVEQVADMERLRAGFRSPRLRAEHAKIFVDGVIEARTAAMLDPYLDRPGFRGEANLTPAALEALVKRLAERGFGVHVHAIGDRGVRMALDAFAAAGPRRGLRHQVAHLQMIDPEDVPRFRALGVIANFQALWAYADDYVVDLTWPALPRERWPFMYPIGSVARSGASLAMGSDWSVSSLRPLDAIQVAVTRQGLSEPRREPMFAAEAIDLPTALAAYTIGSAYAIGLERETGSLEAGKSADLVVLSKNLFAVPPHDIAKQEVLLTLLEGVPVHRDPRLAW